MIPKECKRLIEVDFPIAEVSKQAAREKSIHYGHPSTLHLWWARRPLASSRAVLMGLLLPDPGDEQCPGDFKKKARELLPRLVGEVGKTDEQLRSKLLKFIADFSNWDNSGHPTYLEVARGLVKAAHGDEAPLVVDPFAGGGAIPLEALRVGCDAFAGELNPVATLVLKALLQYIPRHREQLASDIMATGRTIKEGAEQQLLKFYPPDPDGSSPIAYIWSRTVKCESVGCGAEIPLIRSPWLAKRYNEKTKKYGKLISLSIKGDSQRKTVDISIVIHKTPVNQIPKASLPTVSNGKAICPCCNSVLSDKRVRQQLSEQMGGGNASFVDNRRTGGARMVAVVTRKDGSITYRLPNASDYAAAQKASESLASLLRLAPPPQLPNEPLNSTRPSPNARGVSGATRIGITDFGKLFTDRQKLALHLISEKVKNVTKDPIVGQMAALAFSKLVERSTTFVTWINRTEAPRGTFSRQALTIAWDFVELVPIVGSEEFLELVDAIVAVVNNVSRLAIQAGVVEQVDATHTPLPDSSADLWFTDPPYYDSIPYADLSDLFYCWLKLIIPEEKLNQFRATCEDGLTPKKEEVTWNRAHIVNGQSKTPHFFERAAALSFGEGRRVLSSDGIGCVVFAHKSTEGWEALLTGLCEAGWIISASWPIATERPGKLGGKKKAMLMTSVHLVCRPRSESATVADWANVYNEMKDRVANWMERLADEGIRGADLVFACIGPALEAYSRYRKVVDANDREIPLGGNALATEPYKRGYLSYIWEVVGRTALEQVLGTAEARARNGAAGVLEEDARLTALFLWTLKSSPVDTIKTEESDDDEEELEEEVEAPATKGKQKQGYSLIYDVARRFAQPLGIDLGKWTGRIIESKKGVVRLLSVKERAEQLFGNEKLSEIASRLESKKAQDIQTFLFPEEEESAQIPTIRGRKSTGKATSNIVERKPVTTLDRVHAAMLLQASGQAGALKALIESEQERSSDFVRLANALSALYPEKSEEKRLLDAMLLTVPKR